MENNNSNTVTILSGNGTGAFTPYAGSPFATGTNPQQLTVGNFDGLGPAELAVVNGNSGDVTILLNVQKQRATATITGVSVPGHGTHNADVIYAGNTNYSSNTSGTIPLTATPIPTTLALDCCADLEQPRAAGGSDCNAKPIGGGFASDKRRDGDLPEWHDSAGYRGPRFRCRDAQYHESSCRNQ